MCDSYNPEADTVVPVNDELFYAYGPRIDRADSMDYQELIEIPRPNEEPHFWVVNKVRVVTYTSEITGEPWRNEYSDWLANCDSKETAERLANAFKETAKDKEALIAVTAALSAAISLLERGGKQGAASDRIFELMLSDYRKACEAGRAALLSP